MAILFFLLNENHHFTCKLLMDINKNLPRVVVLYSVIICLADKGL